MHTYIMHTYDLFLHSDSGLCGQFSGVIYVLGYHLFNCHVSLLVKCLSLEASELYISKLYEKTEMCFVINIIFGHNSWRRTTFS